MVEFELKDKILELKKNEYVRSISDIATQDYGPIPVNSLLQINVVNKSYIEVTMLEPKTMTISFSNVRDDDSPFFWNFLENIKKVK